MTERKRQSPAAARQPALARTLAAKLRLDHLIHTLPGLVPIGLVVILCIFLLHLFRVSSVAISGDVLASAVTLVLPNGLALEPGLPLDARQKIRLAGYDSGAGPHPLPRRGARATELATLGLAPGATLSMTLRPVRKSHLLQILAFNGVELTIGELQPGDEPGTIPEPQLIRFRAQPNAPVPLQLQATLGGPTADDDGIWPRLRDALGIESPPDLASWADQLTISNVALSALRFAQDSRDQADRAFVSAITSGEITIVALERTLKLSAAEPLDLPGFQGGLTRLALRPDGFHLLFAGTVDQLKLGPIGYPVDKTPTLLDFLLNYPPTRALIAALTWAIGLIGAAVYALVQNERNRTHDHRT